MVTKDIINELFKSEEMREHVKKKWDDLENFDKANLIYNAPITLERKGKLLNELGISLMDFYRTYGYFSVDWALNLLKLAEGEYYLLSRCCMNNDEIVRFRTDTFYSYEKVREYLHREEYVTKYDRNKYWHRLEVWKRDSDGYLIKPLFGYDILDGEICWVKSCGYYIDTPFKTGDIIEVDCRPFRQIGRFVVLEGGNSAMQNFPTVLYVNSNNKIKLDPDESGYKRECVFDNSSIPALYNAKLFKGTLPEEEAFLAVVSQWLEGSEDKGKLLKKFIADNGNESGINLDFVKLFLKNPEM